MPTKNLWHDLCSYFEEDELLRDNRHNLLESHTGERLGEFLYKAWLLATEAQFSWFLGWIDMIFALTLKKITFCQISVTIYLNRILLKDLENSCIKRGFQQQKHNFRGSQAHLKQNLRQATQSFSERHQRKLTIYAIRMLPSVVSFNQSFIKNVQ